MKVRIIQDSDVESPRDWCNASKMYCWHSNYDLGDQHNYNSEDFIKALACEADAGLEEWIEETEYEAERLYDEIYGDYDNASDRAANSVDKADAIIKDRIDNVVEAYYIVLPLALYDHSGISMSVGYGTCPWDSGQVGWIVCDKETIDTEFAGDRDLAEKCLRGEVEVYNQYLTGDTYGFIVEDEDDVEVDSCWGFYGSDPLTNGMIDHIGAEYTEEAVSAEVEYPNY